MSLKALRNHWKLPEATESFKNPYRIIRYCTWNNAVGLYMRKGDFFLDLASRTIHGCFLHHRFIHTTFGLFETATVTQCPPLFLWWTNNVSSSYSIHFSLAWSGQTVWPPGGHAKSKCWFELRKNYFKRDSNSSHSACQASMLAIEPCLLGGLGLIRACGAWT